MAHFQWHRQRQGDAYSSSGRSRTYWFPEDGDGAFDWDIVQLRDGFYVVPFDDLRPEELTADELRKAAIAGPLATLAGAKAVYLLNIATGRVPRS